MSGLPRVAILVLNLNGRGHLERCLPGLDAQVYPNRDIVVVDNGSSDGSLEYVREAHPEARVVAFEENLGFCAAYNRAVEAVEADYVAFLNNDTRVEPNWVEELVSAASRHEASVVGSRILDWEGRRIDFDGGLTAFNGHSWQLNHGSPATGESLEREILFACGGSMLVSREAFLEAGSFDEDFFAYFEDVDLGWRLSVLGKRVVLAPRAVTYHRLHGTSGAWALAPRLRLYERNALAAVFKNYEDRTLSHVLPVAIALALYRALAGAGLDAGAFKLGGSPPPAVAGLPAASMAHLLALEDFGRQLPELTRKREFVQQRRNRTDAELFELFGDPFTLHEVGAEYADAAHALIADFGLREIVNGSRPRARAERRDAPAAVDVMPGRPLVSVVIPTLLGNQHLPACLEALAAQDYPRDRLEVIVVDNGRAHDLTSAVTRAFAGARVIKSGRNLGFAAANNLGASHAAGTFVAFLNDDTRVYPGWVSAMVDVAERRCAACVASYIVDWDGLLVDFAGGLVNFEGKGFQEHINARVDTLRPVERPLLFANGAGMMVSASVLREAGGWDEGTFAYYEDVELGWRLWMLGHEVWLAPGAVVGHRHHGTSGRWPEPPRVRLLERNALRMIYALLETANLAKVLPAALLLAMDRAMLQTPVHRGIERIPTPPPAPERVPIAQRARQELRLRGARRDLPLLANLRRLGARGTAGATLDALLPSLRRTPLPASRREYTMERGLQRLAFDGRREAIPADAAARLIGIHDFLKELPALSTRRAELQSRRVRDDADILRRFGGHWISPVPAADQGLHNELHAHLVRVLGIETIAGVHT